MVARFVEDQHVGFPEQQCGHAKAGSFATAQDTNLFVDRGTTKQHGTGGVENHLILRPRDGFVFQVFEDCFVFRKAGVHVLGVGSEFAAVTPFDFPGHRRQGVHERSKQGRFALAVIPDDGSTRPVVDFQADVRGDGFVGVSDRKAACSQHRALARLDLGSSDHGVGMIG